MKELERVTTNILNSFGGVILFLVSLAAFYLPYEIRIIPVIARVLDPVRYVCAGLLIIGFFTLYISTLTVFRENWALWAALGFVLVLIFSTLMNGGDMESALGTYGLAGLFLVMDIAVFFKVNPKRYLLIAFFFLLAVNIANTYTVFEYCLRRGTGMWEAYGQYTNWFYSLVGNYNGGIEYVLPMAICGSAYAMRYGRWMEFLNYPAMAMSLVMAVSCESLTQVIAFAAIIGFMVLGDLTMLSDGFARILRNVFQPVIFVVIDLAIFVSVVLVNQADWLAKLGIDPDFHNRRHVWNMSMEWIARNPIWGSGQETVGAEASKITGYAHSHCTYLEVAYKTGFVGSVFMILMLAAAVVAIYRNRHSRTSYILTIMLFLFGLAAVAETYPMVYVMLCLGLIYYIAKNTNGTESVRERTKKMKSAQPDPVSGLMRPDHPEPARPEPFQSEEKIAEDHVQEDQIPEGLSEPETGVTGHVRKRRRTKAVTTEAPTVTVVPSAYDIQENELERVGQQVQKVQSEDIEELQESMDNTVHIDETVLFRERKGPRE